MPITIYPTSLKYKNSQNTFQSTTALKSINNIWSDINGSIAIKYWTH